jgi:hypothetical protein
MLRGESLLDILKPELDVTEEGGIEGVELLLVLVGSEDELFVD